MYDNVWKLQLFYWSIPQLLKDQRITNSKDVTSQFLKPVPHRIEGQVSMSWRMLPHVFNLLRCTTTNASDQFTSHTIPIVHFYEGSAQWQTFISLEQSVLEWALVALCTETLLLITRKWWKISEFWEISSLPNSTDGVLLSQSVNMTDSESHHH